MSDPIAVFHEIKQFIDFTDEDAARLKRLAPLFEIHGPGLTDAFYEVLGRFPETSRIIEGRVESLRKTHNRWMMELFAGDYGEAYFTNRMRIGTVHVKVGIAPHFVEAVMDVIRTGGLAVVFAELDREEAVPCSQSLLKILDLDLMIINRAYNEERLERLTAFTGFNRKLIERCIQRAERPARNAAT